MLRRFTFLVALLTLAVACSSGSDSGDIAFEYILDLPSETSVWTASGEVIDSGLLCPTAQGIIEGLEDENGNPRTPADVGALFEASEPFVSVSVELMTCDDDSGEFTLRFIHELDPTITELSLIHI